MQGADPPGANGPPATRSCCLLGLREGKRGAGTAEELQPSTGLALFLRQPLRGWQRSQPARFALRAPVSRVNMRLSDEKRCSLPKNGIPPRAPIFKLF